MARQQLSGGLGVEVLLAARQRLARRNVRPMALLLLMLVAGSTVVAETPRTALVGAVTQEEIEAIRVGGIAAVFEPGLALQDRNGDDQVDFVSAQILLPGEPASGEVAAAAAVAARLGLETAGLSFPLVSQVDAPDLGATALVFLIGDHPSIPAGIASQVARLGEGEGLVARVDNMVVIAGKDPEGTQSAAEAFASRSPYLWGVIGRQNGDTYGRIAAEAESWLADQGVAGVAKLIAFDEVVYATGAAEAARLVMVIDAGADAVRARQEFERLKARHLQGLDSDRLNYASVRNLVVRFSDGGADVVLPRRGVPGRVLNPPRVVPQRFQTRQARHSRRPGRPGPSSRAEHEPVRGRTFDLTKLFTARDGLLADDDGDEVPDDSDTMIVIPAAPISETGYPAVGVAELAARIGLESTGLTLPLVGFDRELQKPEEESRPLVLIGRNNRYVRELSRQGKLRGAVPRAGLGRVEMVPEAFHANSAVVVHGGDRAGEEAAMAYLARRAPHVWGTRLGEAGLDTVKNTVRRLLSARTTAAQAALAAEELDEILAELEDKELESVSVEAFFEEASPEFDDWVVEQIDSRLDVPNVKVGSRARMDPEEVFTDEPEIEWEVDHLRRVFAEQVLAAIQPGDTVSLEARVSEAPELREELAGQLRAEVRAAGGKPGDIRVLSAYKQGLSWLMDQVAPALTGQEVAALDIAWKPFPVDPDTKERFQNEPARWLNELYPADDVLAALMGLPLDAFSFRVDDDSEQIYTATARDAAGSILLQESFSPHFYERPYFDAFEEYATVTVATGWLIARIGNRVVVDERVPTDSDRIWDHFQSDTLDRVYKHIKRTTGDRPTTDKAPFFHTLRIDLEASEPDFRLGLDEEHVSALESLHDDFYFDSLDFFYEVALQASGEESISRSLAAGNVLPWIHSERRGQAPTLKISYSGFASKEAKLVVRYRKEQDESSVDSESASLTPEAESTTEEWEDGEAETRTLEPIEIPDPYLYAVDVQDGADSLERIGVLVHLDDNDALPKLAALLGNLERLRADGLFVDAFAFDGVEQVSVRIEAEGVLSERTFASPEVEEFETRVEPYPPAGEAVVTWDHVISPDESERIAHQLGTLDAVTTYVAGRSYQGRPVSVMEIRLPMEADLVSQAKLNTWKPVLSIIGRQHANEVSSTSHILRLAELLATDPDYRRYLNGMNVVIQPVVNPDGAALAYELQKLTPTHCLHAGRYSALGPDVPGQSNEPDTLVTEAHVLRDVSARWLADIRLNPHGYPSHEWVHQFANYNPKSFRSYWIPRGWWTSVRIPEDPRLHDYRDAARAMLDYIAEEVSGDPESRATNLRIYDRYDRWTIRWQPHVYNLDIHNDTAIYNERRNGAASLARLQQLANPTIFSGFTEAMDETAQGSWLDLVTRMGFGYLMASVRFIADADYELYRLEGETGAGVRLATTRPRPLRAGRRNE